MRLWHCIMISILAHGALLFAPIAVSFNRQMPQPVELQFIVLEDGDRNNAPIQQDFSARESVGNKESPAVSEPSVQEPPAKQTMDRPAERTRELRKENEIPVEETDKIAVPLKGAVNLDDAAKETPDRQRSRPVVKPKQRKARAARRGKRRKLNPARTARSRNPEPAPQSANRATGSNPQGTQFAKAQTGSTGHLSPAARGKRASSKPPEVSFGSQNGPTFRSRTLPKYPMAARHMGKEGTVHLRLTIDRHGQLVKVEVVDKAGWGFDDEAVRAVKHSTFRPARINGEPVTCIAHLQIRFKLRSAK